MQQENEAKLSDGERLDKLKREHRYTWSEIAAELGVTTSMLHMVRRGEKRLGREPSSRLDLIESGSSQKANPGLHASAPPGEIREPAENYAGRNELLGHIVWLEDQLNYARKKEERLIAIIESLTGAGEGRSLAPAAHAAGPVSGANSGSTHTDRRGA